MQTVTHTVVENIKCNFCVHIQGTMQDLEQLEVLSSYLKTHFIRISNNLYVYNLQIPCSKHIYNSSKTGIFNAVPEGLVHSLVVFLLKAVFLKSPWLCSEILKFYCSGGNHKSPLPNICHYSYFLTCFSYYPVNYIE